LHLAGGYRWTNTFPKGEKVADLPVTDGAGNLTELTYPGSPTRKVTYAYDSADRLDTVTDWAARVTRFRYDPATSRLARIELPNGTQRVFTYDSAGRVSAVRDGPAVRGRTLHIAHG
jgi:YD repeat-containing protein